MDLEPKMLQVAPGGLSAGYIMSPKGFVLLPDAAMCMLEALLSKYN
jgi:hypothetical protein